ncbi:MAG: class I SAM-dependent methyltransferase [Bacilli bacterium]|nr:class I SAM-dependent methyltransferase [Bacilli bacterium]
MNDTYKTLVEFWNEGFALTEEDKKQIEVSTGSADDLKGFAPSPKLFEITCSFKDKNNVLDYGCGSGWASLIMAKFGANKVTSVDVAPNSIEMLNCYKKAFGVDNIIDAYAIDENWLGSQEDKYDGLFCSNVIDVVPLEMAKEIVKNAAKAVKKGAKVVFSLNYYVPPKLMEEKGHNINGPHIYINGVLRLTSLTDEEWASIFKQYFKILKIDYFSWSGEEKESRRLFVLQK